MKKKLAIVLASAAAGLAVAAPAAMAADLPGLPGLPELPGLSSSAGEPNGADCTYTPGQATASSEGDVQPVQAPVAGASEKNSGNCESFGNDQGNNMNSGQDGTSFPGLPSSEIPQTPTAPSSEIPQAPTAAE